MPEANINREAFVLNCCQLLREIPSIVIKIPEQNFKKIKWNRSRTTLLGFSNARRVLSEQHTN